MLLKTQNSKQEDHGIWSVTSWQIKGGKVEAVTDFIFLASKFIVDCDFSHKIETHLLLGRKAMTNLDSILKSRHHFVNKGLYIQSYGFSSIMHGYESWAVKRAEYQRIDAFEL